MDQSWDFALERGRKGVPMRRKQGSQTLASVQKQQEIMELNQEFDQKRDQLLRHFEVRFETEFLGIRESGTKIVKALSAHDAASLIRGAFSVRACDEQERLSDWIERNVEYLP